MGVFRFKQFDVDDSGCGMKIGTDSVLLGAWTDTAGVASVIDLGAGSGLLSLMIAQRCPDVKIVGIEIDDAAYSAAQANFSRSPWSARICAVCHDISAYTPQAPVDLIITNPPYFTSELQSPDASRATARHASGGLSPLSAIDWAQRWLTDTGSLAMITPLSFDDAVTYHAEMLKLKIWRKCVVSSVESRPPNRILWQICRDRDRKYQSSSLFIREKSNNVFSQDYINLTQDFYLNF